MPELKDKYLFEPNDDARKSWLGTRKKPLFIGRLTLPGFFHTIDFNKDQNWFLLAVAIEFIAVILTLYGGISRGGIYLVGSIITIVFFIVLDIVGAIFIHKPKPDRCLLKNKIILISDIAVREGLKNQFDKVSLYEIVGVIFIIISALLKVAAILLLGSFNLFFYIIMAFLYVIVIYIHIIHTGYCIAEYSTNNQFTSQHKLWAKLSMGSSTTTSENLNNPYTSRSLSSMFVSSVPILTVNNNIKVGDHFIAHVSDDNSLNQKTNYQYKLSTKGMLTDEDIKLFVNGQGDQESEIIAIACLKHQVEKIY